MTLVTTIKFGSSAFQFQGELNYQEYEGPPVDPNDPFAKLGTFSCGPSAKKIYESSTSRRSDKVDATDATVESSSTNARPET